jgi:hypothetical protein
MAQPISVKDVLRGRPLHDLIEDAKSFLDENRAPGLYPVSEFANDLISELVARLQGYMTGAERSSPGKIVPVPPYMSREQFITEAVLARLRGGGALSSWASRWIASSGSDR